MKLVKSAGIWLALGMAIIAGHARITVIEQRQEILRKNVNEFYWDLAEDLRLEQLRQDRLRK